MRIELQRVGLRAHLALVPLVAALAACSSGPTVTAVQDGDTLTLSTGVRVRLAEIDAPESCQDHGKAATAALVALCAGRPAEVAPVTRDRYGRTVARVACQGADSSASQVAAGHAWVYRRYAPPDSPLYALETTARAARLGLWINPDPIPPWDFRRIQACPRNTP